MKKLIPVVCMLLSVAGIVLLVMSMTTEADNSTLLAAGLFCTSSGSVVNLCMQRKARRGKEKQENG